jgi:SNF2 family DNA or RNA helicase
LNPGDRVRLRDNPSRVGVLTSDPPTGDGRRMRLTVRFDDGEESHLASALERVLSETRDPYLLMNRGEYGGVSHLRGSITQARLSGKLANLIYSLNTTNTRFLPYQFKPVLQYLDSPSRGILIADEVGLGKTIEAGLVWTELRARQDARRLLVVCPAMLQDKWCSELANRFGVKAEQVDAGELHRYLLKAQEDRTEEYALVCSMQGVRPPSGWDSDSSPSQSPSARLARFLESLAGTEPLLDMVIVDEAHYLRNRGTQTHRFAELLRPVTDALVLLSATPIQMRSTDLFNLLHLLDQDAFPLEWTYNYSVEANEPIVALRDRLQARGEVVTQADFKTALEMVVNRSWLGSSEQVEHLLNNLPSDEDLITVRGRSEYADLLDRINPRAKVITRTLKRHVTELHVIREPHTLRVRMTQAEQDFYDRITEAVRDYCEDSDIPDGFMLTIPQRQMSSCLAAACRNWLAKAADDSNLAADSDETDSTVNELVGEVVTLERQTQAGRSQVHGELTSLLVSVTAQSGDAVELTTNDSKFNALWKSLKTYWAQNPGKKVILFAFYRPTLYHLARKFAELVVRAMVLHGGMDKQASLKEFESNPEIPILLSSEVASEGVDLQFSSVVVNYDLPWNPARIEQRIGRIDRIGQEAPKILIWNLVYEGTLDERVYDRLLERLNIFRKALGNMEELLGAEVRKLTTDLLTHKLTAEQEVDRIQQSAMALENLRINEEQLNERASQLLGHGDFIQNKAKAAMDLGRYIQGDDLYFFIKDHLESTFAGTRVIVDDGEVRRGAIEFSMAAKVAFEAFSKDVRLQGRTSLLSPKPRELWFDNKTGNVGPGVEKVSQDHPLVRFVAHLQKSSPNGGRYFPTSAALVPAARAGRVTPGIYVYVVIRWSFSGPRDIERLVYEGQCLMSGQTLESDDIEALVNAAAMHGFDWQGVAANTLDHNAVAEAQDACRSRLESHFDKSKAAQMRENRDRIREMNSSLEADLKKRREAAQLRIRNLEAAKNPRNKGLLTIERNKLANLEKKYREQMHKNSLREELDPREKHVSSGVIRVERGALQKG